MDECGCGNCVSVCALMCECMCVNVHVYVSMCVGVSVCGCVYGHVCRGVCGRVYGHVCRGVCGRVYGHVCRGVCGRVYGHVCRGVCGRVYGHVCWHTCQASHIPRDCPAVPHGGLIVPHFKCACARRPAPPHMANPTPPRLIHLRTLSSIAQMKEISSLCLISMRFIESAKTAKSRSLQTHAQTYNIVPMNIIIIGLSCNFFKCPAKMSRVSCIDFYSGWQVCVGDVCGRVYWHVCRGECGRVVVSMRRNEWVL